MGRARKWRSESGSPLQQFPRGVHLGSDCDTLPATPRTPVSRPAQHKSAPQLLYDYGPIPTGYDPTGYAIRTQSTTSSRHAARIQWDASTRWRQRICHAGAESRQPYARESRHVHPEFDWQLGRECYQALRSRGQGGLLVRDAGLVSQNRGYFSVCTSWHHLYTPHVLITSPQPQDELHRLRQ